MAWREKRLWILLIALCVLREVSARRLWHKGFTRDQLRRGAAGHRLQNPQFYLFNAQTSEGTPSFVSNPPGSASSVTPQVSQNYMFQSSSQLSPVAVPEGVYFGFGLPVRRSDDLVFQDQSSDSSSNFQAQLQQQGAPQQVSSGNLLPVYNDLAFSSSLSSQPTRPPSGRPHRFPHTHSQPQRSPGQQTSSQQAPHAQQTRHPSGSPQRHRFPHTHSQPQRSPGQQISSQQVLGSQQPDSVWAQFSQQAGLQQASSDVPAFSSQPQGPSDNWPTFSQEGPASQQPDNFWVQFAEQLGVPQGSQGKQVVASHLAPRSRQPGSVWPQVSWQAGLPQTSDNVATVSSQPQKSPVQFGHATQTQPVSKPLHPPQSLGLGLASTSQGSSGGLFFPPSWFPPQVSGPRPQLVLRQMTAKLFTRDGKLVASGSLSPVSDFPRQTVLSQGPGTSQVSRPQGFPSGQYVAPAWLDQPSPASQPSNTYDFSQLYSSSFSGGQQQSGSAVSSAQAQSSVAQVASSGSSTSGSPGSYGIVSSQSSAADAITGGWSGPSVVSSHSSTTLTQSTPSFSSLLDSYSAFGGLSSAADVISGIWSGPSSVAQVTPSDSTSVNQSTSGSASVVSPDFFSGSQMPSSTAYSFYQNLREPSSSEFQSGSAQHDFSVKL
ncbi:AT-rich interactive domain-containing protein 1A-like [Hoplias malabaricus]|uniref:AT-rich interactive domain-containing protein 1A-like n=1 Tax=Hoplias malabaricus TaxID=27720 RepID=UPI003461F365